ncbi:5-hydroxytryptamine receptor 3A isoform X3 [Oryzias latipes]|uniref:5-hydroxytryptamine receptor 3A isoform X3 n=1 Tax=Oryzias latipes TaxID=8090 RepID=UPI000CE1FDBE|nr:5-hydroxytryptamine receptor 3A isoform X3 [Oryzias latipes]
MLAQSVFVLFLTVSALGVWSASGFNKVQNGSLSSDNRSPETSEENCSYYKVLEYLNLTKDKDLFAMIRPVKNHRRVTRVYIKMILYAILDVREVDQTFVSYVWIYMKWFNEYIKWKPKDLCGIRNFTVPNQVLWKPDLTIEEMIEKDKAPPSPLLQIDNHGYVVYKNDQVIISTCQMHVYRFPFDTQSCTITFKSIFHRDYEISLSVYTNNTEITKWSRDNMRAQYEWVFKNITVQKKTEDSLGYNKTSVIYTISMSRRSTLYCFNFLVPILFLIILDMASLLIPDNGGEKLSFKVTVLLAVTVMQLILNEILPSSTETIPLVAIHDDETDQNTPSPKKDSSSQRLDVSLALDLFSHELDEVKKTVSLLSSRRENIGYWTKLSQKIHKIFTVFYVGGVVLFLITISMLWIVADDD